MCSLITPHQGCSIPQTWWCSSTLSPGSSVIWDLGRRSGAGETGVGEWWFTCFPLYPLSLFFLPAFLPSLFHPLSLSLSPPSFLSSPPSLLSFPSLYFFLSVPHPTFILPPFSPIDTHTLSRAPLPYCDQHRLQRTPAPLPGYKQLPQSHRTRGEPREWARSRDHQETLGHLPRNLRRGDRLMSIHFFTLDSVTFVPTEYYVHGCIVPSPVKLFTVIWSHCCVICG